MTRPISATEARVLFANLAPARGLVLAVSGGPDSTALLVLAARWRKARKRGPKLLALTIDHGLRPESAREAESVKRLARRLGVSHRTLRWRGRKPATGLQQAARTERYRLLRKAALAAGATHIVTAHTLDDQAETVLFRLLRGSGLAGLAGMAPEISRDGLLLVRPLLAVPKTRLVATLDAAKIPFADDPSNRDPRFARTRLRALLPKLAEEGCDAARLATLARRAARANAALESAVTVAAMRLSATQWRPRGPVIVDAVGFVELSAEVALRLLGRALACAGNEGPVELAKLEALYDAMTASRPFVRRGPARLRRTLAGAVVTLTADRLTVERAPPRRRGRNASKRFTLSALWRSSAATDRNSDFTKRL
jgi:tRNA(Ile)-lysidine synthase